MSNLIVWNRSKLDMLTILTSDCGVYEIRENYPENDDKYSLCKNGYYDCCGSTQSELKDCAEWDKKHN